MSGERVDSLVGRVDDLDERVDSHAERIAALYDMVAGQVVVVSGEDLGAREVAAAIVDELQADEPLDEVDEQILQAAIRAQARENEGLKRQVGMLLEQQKRFQAMIELREEELDGAKARLVTVQAHNEGLRQNPKRVEELEAKVASLRRQVEAREDRLERVRDAVCGE